MRNVSLDFFFQYVKNSACQKDAKVKIYMGEERLGVEFFIIHPFFMVKYIYLVLLQLNFSV